MLILARFMRLKALDTQTDRGSVARYTSTAPELRDVCGCCPTAVRPFDLSLCIHWTVGSTVPWNHVTGDGEGGVMLLKRKTSIVN